MAYIVKAVNANTDAISRTFAGDQAPGLIHIMGGHAEGITNGILVSHTGSENTEWYSGPPLDGTYNTTPVGPVIVQNLDIKCTGKVATPTTSVRPISCEGYVSLLIVENVSVEFPSGVAEYYDALFLGSGELRVSGGKKKRTRGILFGAKGGCLNEAGATVTLTPTRFACPAWPDYDSLKSGDAWLNSTLARETVFFNMPPAQRIYAEALPITAPSNTSENQLVGFHIPSGWPGKRGHFKLEMLFTTTSLNTNAKNVRARLGGLTGTVFHQTNMNSTSNGLWRINSTIVFTDYNVQIGPPSALTTFGSNNGSPVPGAIEGRNPQDLVITVEKAVGADDAVCRYAMLEFQPG